MLKEIILPIFDSYEDTIPNYLATAVEHIAIEISKYLEKESNLLFLNPKILSVDQCLANASCSESRLDYKFKEYLPGKIFVEMEPLKQDFRIAINEIGWRGWKVTSCEEQGNCQESEVSKQEDDLILSSLIPANTSSIIYEYKTPYLIQAWALFYSTLVLILITSFMLNKKEKA